MLLLAARSASALVRAGGRRTLSTLRAVPTTFPLSSRERLDVTYGGSASDFSGDMLVLPFWQADTVDIAAATSAGAWDASLDGALTELVADQKFKGKAGESCVLTVPQFAGVKKVALVGLGKRDDDAAAAAYRALGKSAAALALSEKSKVVGVAAPSRSRDAWRISEYVEALALAACEGSYVDNRFRTGDNVKDPSPLAEVTLVDEPPAVDVDSPDDAYAPSLEDETAADVVAGALGRARAYAAGAALARDLVNAPANVLTPRTMAIAAVELARGRGARARPGERAGERAHAADDAIAAVELAKQHATLTAKVMGPVECAAQNMGAYLGVAQGASPENEAQFVHLTYTQGVPKTRVCIVGKGLTYDSGGYNLKPSAGGMIELMKFDMGGAAATLGCAAAVAQLGVPDCEVHFIVAACENMISGDAVRPGDVLTASNGKTIEVANTDAEGRLTLADALVYAEKLAPDAIVDLATLTGACIVALGDDVAGLFSADDALVAELEGASRARGEQLWRMPMPPAYEEDIKSKIADLKNVGSRAGGAITAALFLGHFVEDVPHAHIDLAGPVWDGKEAGATGFGAKTMAQWVEARAAAA
eukprot:CAMPEP_0119296446 /NCGR_PEP_ID=MMETSP1329-20130426/50574_1 /TAXON_ID=114041 /ORGANISM="Genus nov. species nov., Strain RCC1024" /LENGTH=592 /DNA_ID=CAMNT_0007297379 /DNA_START=112 /DNA_END=1887 /DNA_ORIENTATION=+